MAKEQKSQAELYREERKKRIAQASKGKKGGVSVGANTASDKTDKKIAIGVIVVLAVLLMGWLVSFLGIPQRMTTVMKVGDEKVSKAEYTYYYRQAFLTTYQQAYMIKQQYGISLGYDYTKSPEEQEYAGSGLEEKEDGSKPTWGDYFRQATENSIVQKKILCAEAEKLGVKLDENDLKEIDKQIEELRKSVEDEENGRGVSLNVYFRTDYGSGVNEKFFRQLCEEEALAKKVSAVKDEEFEKSVTDEEINKNYEENKDDYDVIDIAAFAIAIDEESEENKVTKEDAKKKAEEMLAKVTDAESFLKYAKEYAPEADKEKYGKVSDVHLTSVSKANVEESIGEDAVKWSFDAARKDGDKTVIVTDDAAFVLLLTGARHRDDSTTVDVRHILIQYEDDATAEQKAAVDKKAEELYAQWQKGDKSENSFADLAKEESADSSASNGGLIENIAKGQMVEEFEAWCLDEARKPGDTGIVKTKYGSHIMYFSEKNAEALWKTTIKESLAGDMFAEYYEELEAQDAYKLEKNDKKLLKLSEKLSKPAI